MKTQKEKYQPRTETDEKETWGAKQSADWKINEGRSDRFKDKARSKSLGINEDNQINLLKSIANTNCQ